MISLSDLFILHVVFVQWLTEHPDNPNAPIVKATLASILAANPVGSELQAYPPARDALLVQDDE